MYAVYNCLAIDHSPASVVLAVIVLALGLISSIVVYNRGLRSNVPHVRRAWAGCAGFVTGLAIWATHFVAMLGYRPGFDVRFDGWVTLGSAAIVTSGLVLKSQILIGGLTLPRRAAAAVLATAAVAVMHYYGLAALNPSALIEYDPQVIAASVLLSGALFGATYLFGVSEKRPVKNAGGVVAVVGGVAVLHFGGMMGTQVLPIRGMHHAAWTLTHGGVIHVILACVVLMICLAAAAAGVDTVLERILFRERRRQALLADSASEAILICSDTGAIVEANAAAERLFGRRREDLTGLKAEGLIRGMPTPGREEAVQGLRAQTQVVHTGGEAIPAEITLRQLDAGASPLMVVTLSDQRERLKHEAEIRTLAFTDHMTGLANRVAFQRDLEARLSRHVADPKLQTVVILIDLDQFKEVNDQFGHSAGDAMLQQVSQRLRAVFVAPAVAARLGGDEFAVALTGQLSRDNVSLLGQKLLAALSQPVPFGDIMISCSASIGIAISDEERSTTEELLKAAERAMYAAKIDGRADMRIYDEALHRLHESRRGIEQALIQAIQNGEFVFHYQPKACSRTRKVHGYEALIRWERPGHGLIMPDHFIEIAEQSMLIVDIGRFAIVKACMDAASWDHGLTVAVNLSVKQLADPKLYQTVRQALRQSGLDPERLELEITETALIQNLQLASEVLGRLKRLGVRIALDDFGTGYSSMQMVQQFPFDRIKIDKSFILSMESDPKSRAIVDAILRLGHNLSIPVVAEGVETEAQAEALIAADCEELQGFLISRPIPMSKDFPRHLTLDMLRAG